MKNKVALITGANKGIGFETARQLGKLGYTILLGARDDSRGNAATLALKDNKIDAHFIKIDPTDPQSVKEAVKKVENQFNVLDVLINNAGVFFAEDLGFPPALVPTEIFKKTYDINVFGVHEVTGAFWDLLNKSDAARLVNVSSGLGSFKLHTDNTFADFKPIAYDSSKSALNMMTIHYAWQWKGTAHKANTLHPGSVKTDMNKNGELTVEEGAKTSVYLATLAQDGPNGKFFHMKDEMPW